MFLATTVKKNFLMINGIGMSVINVDIKFVKLVDQRTKENMVVAQNVVSVPLGL
jgi:hypothetical protein